MAAVLYNPGRERPVRKDMLAWFGVVHFWALVGLGYQIMLWRESLDYESWSVVWTTLLSWNLDGSTPERLLQSLWILVSSNIAYYELWLVIWSLVMEPAFVTGVTLFCLCHLSITTTIHRYYAHRAFEMTWWLELILLILFCATFQGIALWWAFRHRQHHDFSDTERDPYTVLHGFWWAHWLWILHDPGTIEDRKKLGNLNDNKLLLWQERNSRMLSFLFGLGMPTALASLWGDPLGGLLVGGFLRLFFQYHLTWCINSWAHSHGHFHNDVRIGTARDNWMLGPPTAGEGSAHGRHHEAPEDYRIDPRWYAIDAGKWFIWSMSLTGATWNLRRVGEQTVKLRQRKRQRTMTHV